MKTASIGFSSFADGEFVVMIYGYEILISTEEVFNGGGLSNH